VRVRVRQIFLAGVLGLGVTVALRAQVSVEIAMDQENFLAGETIPLTVRVINRSGQTLRLGETPDWLTFAVASRATYIAEKSGDVPVLGPFELESGKTALRRVTLTPYFVLTHAGRYEVTASVRIPQWETTVVSPPKTFEIVNAARIWAQNFGMPLAPGTTNVAPEVRRYSLEQANYLRGKLRLYLRLMDAESDHVFKVIPIGGMVSFSSPEARIDRRNCLHVLYQFGAHSYLYTVVTPEGEITTQQTYEITQNRPRLAPDEQGGFFVAGGQRRLTDADIPTPPAAVVP